jgi:hypothetical protein
MSTQKRFSPEEYFATRAGKRIVLGLAIASTLGEIWILLHFRAMGFGFDLLSLAPFGLTTKLTGGDGA